ncbi:hypothetical protein ILUMI_26411 [Ignelater luminosus]|uniref:EGF-like domain-containing protein n=1 Tax=Ignelater luminosus TaxID=2038154 RepID=A0A8K0C820_IGNLU|nr:hypothetical protein ILUMI_26411 [Ignelater luminosus]
MKHPTSAVIYFIIFKISMGLAKYHFIEKNDLEDKFPIPCDTIQQCEEFGLNAFKCVDNVCVCKDKMCEEPTIEVVVTKIGKDCKESLECKIEQSFCNEKGKCDCITNTVASEDKRKCLNVSYLIGSFCQENAQCASLNGICKEGKCGCPEDMHISKGICFKTVMLGLPCKKDEECSHTEFSNCKSHVCVCNQDYVKSKTDLKCLLKSQNFSSSCTEDIQCLSSFGLGSICDNGLCLCTELHQYKASINKCVLDARLGEQCSSHTDCHQPGRGESRLECFLGVCKCKSDYFEDEGYCIFNSSVSSISFGLRIHIKCCTMNISFLLILFFCSRTYSQSNFERLESFYYCKYDSDCDENSFCFGNDINNLGRCRCKENFILLERNRTVFECLAVAEGIDSPCTKDLQCQVNLRTPAVCSETENVCKCGHGAHLAEDKKCYRRIALGERCGSSYNCLLGDGTYGWCYVGYCSCKANYHPSEDGQRCIPSVPLGKTCVASESCIHTAANCYGGICKCVAGYIENDNNTVCLKAANKIGDSCAENSQCSAYITDAFCLKEVCSCRSAHHGYGNECVPDAYLGNRCTHSKECILSPEFQFSVHCQGGVCACVEGVTSENEYGCVIVPNSSAKVYFAHLLVVLGLIFVGYN